MTKDLPKNASVATAMEGAKLHAPSAARNTDFLCDLLKKHAPSSGQALEIASGTGQHIVAFAKTLPGVTWQPTEVEEARRASIDAYRAEANLPNLRPARLLDATRPDWHRAGPPVDLIVLVNLLHLISGTATQTLLHEALAALRVGGRFILYGPFKRAGALTSPGDIRFDADLRAADPTIGYKDDLDIVRQLTTAGAASVQRIDMLANNLAFVATKG
ncbi:DUF938 domain-containing protein [uncultured Roseobacter sp.]|uniref:DUF938 domain-containing protein n=1 Tax=uncultured Roseobacter sp. TaxID=114847 RepID=UPI002625F1C9|nr:DUF938 domain-containing protein [uncultured Roseobacter sp.]